MTVLKICVRPGAPQGSTLEPFMYNIFIFYFVCYNMSVSNNLINVFLIETSSMTD